MQPIIIIILFAFVFASLFFNVGINDLNFLIPFTVFLGIIFLISIYSLTIKTIISDAEISTQSILGTKTLAWNEISRVSGKNYKIKLHNLSGDITVAPSSQLPGFNDIIEQIGLKRPDLFNPLDYGEMKRSWLVAIPLVLLPIIFLATLVEFGVLFFNKSETPIVVFILLVYIIIIAIAFYRLVLSPPQSVILDRKSIFLKYLFSERTLLADGIESIEFRFTQTRNGKYYFILLTQTNRKSLRISGLNIGLPIVYLVLKNWHKKSSENQSNLFEKI